jgi:3-oxoacyl-[acyl-carrier-protein] synthase III
MPNEGFPMNALDEQEKEAPAPTSFFDEEGVKVERLPYGDGVPLGIRQACYPELGIGGAYGTWGEAFDNRSLPNWIEANLGEPLSEEDRMDLAPLGFLSRHHTQDLDDDQHRALEIEVGARFLRAAAEANGWRPEEIEGVLIGSSGPVAADYTAQIAGAAGIPERALKVSVHKACDSSVGALHLLMNPRLPANQRASVNIAEELRGKKVLVGGIEGLSRFIRLSRDRFAMQIFGNGAGVIGLRPEEGTHFLAGRTHEVFDKAGVLEMRMYYPHSGNPDETGSLVEVSQAGDNHIRVAGRMHEPEGDIPVRMASPVGMVKLFVRTGVEFVRDFYSNYVESAGTVGEAGKEFATVIVHHANLKINQLKEKHLGREGLRLPLPWVMSEFGNVSAASNMIAFLRQLADLKAGDRILIYGFGAGTYYDALAVELRK